MSAVDLRLGDCLDVLASLDAESVDAVVTDPPYGISFMGKHWDRFDIEERVGKRDVSKLGVRLTGGIESPARKETARTTSAYANAAGAAGGYDFSATGNRAFQQWVEQWASECVRILKPGGHLVSFGGTRTYHRLAAGVEDAGFEIRDQLAWMFGSGFPKSLDVSKAIDARAGHLRGQRGDLVSANGSMSGSNYERTDKGEPVTAAAAAAGWGTALKPGYEPIVLARKPLSGTVAANVMEHGTGALNIDGCRIETEDDLNGGGYGGDLRDPNPTSYGLRRGIGQFVQPTGRWPANVCLDEEAADLLDSQTGPSSSSSSSMELPRTPGDARGQDHGGTGLYTTRGHDDFGGASRFFYCAKVDGDERHQGLTIPSLFSGDTAPDRNHHPTVKPISLMRWLCRLVTPTGGLIVDPFLGSGTTGIAAALEGYAFLGIEREPDYMRIAEARISHWAHRPVAAQSLLAGDVA